VKKSSKPQKIDISLSPLRAGVFSPMVKNPLRNIAVAFAKSALKGLTIFSDGYTVYLYSISSKGNL
jgi:hypothetical protein